MLLIVGTVPIPHLPLTTGVASLNGEFLEVDGQRIPCTQGTAAMISAAVVTTDYLKLDSPHALVVGDTGKGKGSHEMYEYLIKNIDNLSLQVLALHYCLPDIALMRRLCEAITKCAQRPKTIADAASMYAAKAAFKASEFDIFTPDASEMAFLADADATHPAYIAKHLFDTEVSDIPELINTAYENKGASKLLLVKGATDYIVGDGEIIDTVTDPNVPTLEAIGGTGDTITGMVSAFTYAELEPHEAASIAAKANRMAGQYANATPATTVRQIIEQFPNVFKDNLYQWNGVCYSDGGKK